MLRQLSEAQCEYILNRTYSIASVSEDALSIETIDILFDNLGSLIQSDNAENNKASIEKAIFDLEKSDCEETAKAALLSDLRFALKIASLSRDEAKEKYRLENPLPGEESSDAVSDNADESNDESYDNSQSASESSDISATKNDNRLKNRYHCRNMRRCRTRRSSNSSRADKEKTQIKSTGISSKTPRKH